MTNEGQILEEWLAKKRWSALDLAKELGVSKQNVYHHLKKESISNDFKNRLLNLGFDVFAEIIPVDSTQITKVRNGKGKGAELVPFFDVDFHAGNSPELLDNAITPAYYMDVPEFRGCTAFRAYSDSMEKLIKSGNILYTSYTKPIQRIRIPIQRIETQANNVLIC